MINFLKTNGKVIGIIASVVAIITPLFQYYENCRNKNDLYKKQLNQVSIKFEKGAIHPDNAIEFIATVYNGSDVNLKDVSIISPVDILQMDNGEISIDESGKMRGVSLGDVGPSKERVKTILVKNDELALSSLFEIEFKDIKDKWWSKKPDKEPKKKDDTTLKKLEMKYEIKEADK